MQGVGQVMRTLKMCFNFTFTIEKSPPSCFLFSHWDIFWDLMQSNIDVQFLVPQNQLLNMNESNSFESQDQRNGIRSDLAFTALKQSFWNNPYKKDTSKIMCHISIKHFNFIWLNQEYLLDFLKSCLYPPKKIFEESHLPKESFSSSDEMTSEYLVQQRQRLANGSGCYVVGGG